MRNKENYLTFKTSRAIWISWVICICFFVCGTAAFAQMEDYEYERDDTYGKGGFKRTTTYFELNPDGKKIQTGVSVILFDNKRKPRKETSMSNIGDITTERVTFYDPSRYLKEISQTEKRTDKFGNEISFEDVKYDNKTGKKIISGLRRSVDKFGNKKLERINPKTGKWDIVTDDTANTPPEKKEADTANTDKNKISTKPETPTGSAPLKLETVGAVVNELQGYIDEIEKYRQDGKARFVKGLKDTFNDAYKASGARACDDCYVRASYLLRVWGDASGSDSAISLSLRNLNNSISYLRKQIILTPNDLERIQLIRKAMAEQRERQMKLVEKIEVLIGKEVQFWKIFFQHQDADRRVAQARTKAEEASLRPIAANLLAQLNAIVTDSENYLKEAKVVFPPPTDPNAFLLPSVKSSPF